MKGLKKVSAMALSVLMLFALLQTGAAATETPEFRVGDAGVSAGAAGEMEAVIPVMVKDNPGFSGLELLVSLPEGWKVKTEADPDGGERVWIDDRRPGCDETLYSVMGAADQVNGYTPPSVWSGSAEYDGDTAVCRLTASADQPVTQDGYICWITCVLPETVLCGDYLISVTAVQVYSAQETGTNMAGRFTCTPGTVTVTSPASKAETVCIQKAKLPVACDCITIPETGTASAVYTAVVTDQYGAAMENPAVTWTLDEPGKGVSVENGAVAVAPDAAEGTYILTASCEGKSAQVELSVVDLELELLMLEFADYHVYGATWGELVTRVIATASDDGTPVAGTFSVLHAETVPDAGDQMYTIVFSGADYENVPVYTGTLTILRKAVTVTGLTAQDKTYDGSTSASLAVSGAKLEGVVGDDALMVVSAAGAFEDKAVGSGKKVHISEVVLGGADAANYTVGDKSQTETTASITARPVTVSGITALDRVYDGSTGVELDYAGAVLAGSIEGDDLRIASAAGAFADQNAGVEKPVILTEITLDGHDADNYTVSLPAGLTASVFPKPVTITGTAAEDKIYDGTCDAKIQAPGCAEGVLSGDGVSVQPGAASFASSGAGENIPVTFSGFTLTGADADNYKLDGQPAPAAANIAKAVYTGETVPADIRVMTQQTAVQTGSLTASDFFLAAPAGAQIAAVAAQTAEHGIVSSMTVTEGTLTYTCGAELPAGSRTDTYTVIISCPNYRDIEVPLTVTTVDKTPVTVSGIAVAGKTYDGQVLTYTGTPAAKTAGGETVEVEAFTYTWKDGGGNLLASAPRNAGTYTLTVAVEDSRYTGSVTLDCTIAKAAVTITVQDASAQVGQMLPAFTYRVAGLAQGDSLQAEPVLTCAAGTNQAGVYPIKASGAQAPEGGNYDETILYVDGALTVSGGETGGLNGSHSGETGGLKGSDGSETVYTDVAPDAWYAEAVAYTTEQGLMNGMGEGAFVPDGAVTRAMVWTVLARMDGENAGGGSAWYAGPQRWAVENGVSDGTYPEAAITREQLAAMLYRFCGSPAVRGSLQGYADGAAVSDWAGDAMLWAVEQGLIEGLGGNTLAPAADTTRAQLAQILMRFDEKF